MANSYNISRSNITKHKAPFDFMFEWDNGVEKTFIAVSLHGAKALGEAFKNFGYEEEEGSVQFINFESEDHAYTTKPEFKSREEGYFCDGD